MTDQDEDRTQAGRFVAGHKVLSPGAPRGVSKSELIRAMLEPNRDQACAKLIELTNLGDPAAMKLYFQYLSPPPKPEAEFVRLPGLKDARTLQDKAAVVLDAVADSLISAEAAGNLLRMLETFGKTALVEAHDRRLDAIDGVTMVLPDEPCDLA
ncbi:MAG: hypothetical protein KA207_02835 [Burkholderiaceae bacterium]|nr:hypothetical protein [Burkholderiaceae bacterium]